MKAGEFKGRDVTLTISSVALEELEGSKGKQVKGIVGFKGTQKQWVLNKTNGLCLRGMFGRNTDDWIGKRVTLYPAAIQFEDADICIRVRGSPDIAETMQLEIRLARKKPRAMTMQKTGGKAGPKLETPSAKPAVSAPTDEHGDPFVDQGPPDDVRLPG